MVSLLEFDVCPAIANARPQRTALGAAQMSAFAARGEHLSDEPFRRADERREHDSGPYRLTVSSITDNVASSTLGKEKRSKVDDLNPRECRPPVRPQHGGPPGRGDAHSRFLSRVTAGWRQILRYTRQ
jgi:hypothetical protein